METFRDFWKGCRFYAMPIRNMKKFAVLYRQGLVKFECVIFLKKLFARVLFYKKVYTFKKYMSKPLLLRCVCSPCLCEWLLPSEQGLTLLAFSLLLLCMNPHTGSWLHFCHFGIQKTLSKRVSAKASWHQRQLAWKRTPMGTSHFSWTH